MYVCVLRFTLSLCTLKYKSLLSDYTEDTHGSTLACWTEDTLASPTLLTALPLSPLWHMSANSSLIRMAKVLEGIKVCKLERQMKHLQGQVKFVFSWLL